MKYKYKKQIVTGAIALSLLISGSSVFAATPQDLGIKKSANTYQKQIGIKQVKTGVKKQNSIVGAVSTINGLDFTIDVKNLKTKVISSIDVQTNTSTTFSKNGVSATISDLAVGQKVIITGTLDKTTNILTAKKVKITTVTITHKKGK
jgi:hypothetical protein